MASQAYDAERAQPSSTASSGHEKRPANSRSNTGSSWAVLDGIKESYEQFDARNTSQAHLVYAGGDVPENKVSKFYHFLLSVSIVTRWFLFIVPVLVAIWIPGILGVTEFPDAKIWATKLIWWSIWLTVVWAGWWGALATSRIVPVIARATIGVVAVSMRRYIDWLQALHRYIALFSWALVNWITWNPLIKNNQLEPSDGSRGAISLIGKLLFGLFICTAILLFEKFAIQFIAGKFHERSYADRINDQKFAVNSLVTLYRHSSEIPGRAMDSSTEMAKGSFVNPKRVFKKITKGVKLAATTTTTALGNVASEIAGSSVLQPNSPQAIIKTTLESANKSRLLARRIYYSFAKPKSEYMLVEDISRLFPTIEEATEVFALFDKDGNGDASLEEMEMAVMEFHREQLSIENSMRDLDSAVGRLDNIFMSLYVIIAALVLAICMEAQFVSIITGAGTLILGLSWLIGGSLQEVLTSIIFLFIKHPFDVGDRVVINGNTYVVKEIRLLSTAFLDSNSTSVQAPNVVLNGLFIQNYRRSPQMSETFTFDVSYSTSFEDLERLREKMLEFVKRERRDYHPSFDVTIKDFPDQDKMTLSVDIKYKSNSQLASLKSKRRNKWICALKEALAETRVFGPGGDPNPAPSVTRYTAVPWDTVLAEDNKAAWEKAQAEQQRSHHHAGSWNLTDKNAVITEPTDDIFNASNDVSKVTTPLQEFPNPITAPGPYVPGQPQVQFAQAPPHAGGYSGLPPPSLSGSPLSMPAPSSAQLGAAQRGAGDVIEMQPRRA